MLNINMKKWNCLEFYIYVVKNKTEIIKTPNSCQWGRWESNNGTQIKWDRKPNFINSNRYIIPYTFLHLEYFIKNFKQVYLYIAFIYI